MEGLNRIISLFLGLIVVIILLGMIMGRINLKGRFTKLADISIKPASSPTPSTIKPEPKITIRVTSESTGQTNYYKQPTLTPIKKYYNQKTTSIPSTGVPTIFLPFALSGLIGGMYLRNKL
jgi:hypothetical protein